YAALETAVDPGERAKSAAQAAESFVERVTALQQELRLPRRLRDLGVKPEHFEAIVEQSLPSSSLKHNPREAGARELQQLLEQAW
ncbi:MAG: iron-containing alcohol dehydrogenase, partial [Dethiobacteria bacterium]